MSIETLPRDLRGLRACLVCGLIKSADQFELDGCENCERFLNLKNDIEKVHECTSANFDGMIAVCDQSDSWICKWQKIGNSKCKGMYAVSVSGSLPKHVITELKEYRIRYKPNMRDKSIK
ncbi:spt4/RpoE2 zinc finger domain-containing protein [Ditylenchus destructor]|uniref:Transcription elongation factor SPT4 n=1 Tax=Ditylenchus destructor TaxID=166010 RepID=A0AAD4N4H3_9BILA|nr:spt4/RpoE2 zinc finger domain-containing protein [Ditylenchus destructor]